MSIVAALLDQARAGRGFTSDNALAAALGQHRQTISQWRHGESYPSEDNIVALADMAKADPSQWLVAIKAVRADGPAGKVWAALAKRLGAAAAVVLCAIGLAMGAAPGTAQAKALSAPLASQLPSNADYVARGMQLMFGRVWRYYASLLRLLLERLLQRDRPHKEFGSISACR